MKKSLGFTLVELLVVIAIIGILAAVVLRSLNDARLSSVDARIQSEMDSLSKQALISFSPNAGFNSVCGTSGVPQDETASRLTSSIASVSSGTVVCNSATEGFAVSAQLENGYWCVDGEAVKKEIAAPLNPGQTECP